MKQVIYRKEDRKIEVALVLPHPDLPLELAVPEDVPGSPGGDVRDRQCPGPEPVYLLPDFEPLEVLRSALGRSR